MPSDCYLHQVIQSYVFKFLRLMLVTPATYVISEPFPWLSLNRLSKQCVAFLCIIMVVCSTDFFHKRTFSFENC